MQPFQAVSRQAISIIHQGIAEASTVSLQNSQITFESQLFCRFGEFSTSTFFQNFDMLHEDLLMLSSTVVVVLKMFDYQERKLEFKFGC